MEASSEKFNKFEKFFEKKVCVARSSFNATSQVFRISSEGNKIAAKPQARPLKYVIS